MVLPVGGFHQGLDTFGQLKNNVRTDHLVVAQILEEELGRHQIRRHPLGELSQDLVTDRESMDGQRSLGNADVTPVGIAIDARHGTLENQQARRTLLLLEELQALVLVLFIDQEVELVGYPGHRYSLWLLSVGHMLPGLISKIVGEVAHRLLDLDLDELFSVRAQDVGVVEARLSTDVGHLLAEAQPGHRLEMESEVGQIRCRFPS